MLATECIVFNRACSSVFILRLFRDQGSCSLSECVRELQHATVAKTLTIVFTLDYIQTFKISVISLELFEGLDQDSELHSRFSMEGIIKCRTFQFFFLPPLFFKAIQLQDQRGLNTALFQPQIALNMLRASKEDKVFSKCTTREFIVWVCVLWNDATHYVDTNSVVLLN